PWCAPFPDPVDRLPPDRPLWSSAAPCRPPALLLMTPPYAVEPVASRRALKGEPRHERQPHAARLATTRSVAGSGSARYARSAMTTKASAEPPRVVTTPASDDTACKVPVLARATPTASRAPLPWKR